MITRVQTPCLIQLGKDELAVISEIKNDNLIIARPRYGLKKYKIIEFVKNFADQKVVPVLILQTTNKTPKKKIWT